MSAGLSPQVRNQKDFQDAIAMQADLGYGYGNPTDRLPAKDIKSGLLLPAPRTRGVGR